MLTLPTRRWGLVVVRGRSMLPTLCDGERLLVHYGQLPVPGELAVVRFDGLLVIKRLDVREANSWWFSRDNPAEGVDSWTRGMPSVTSDVLATVRAGVWPRIRRL